MGGALQVTGSAAYINDSCENANTARLIFRWSSRSHTERLEPAFVSDLSNYCMAIVAEGEGRTPPVRTATVSNCRKARNIHCCLITMAHHGLTPDSA
jgi:hypothetical protein